MMTQPIAMYLAVLSLTLASCNTESITASDEITIIDHSVPTFSSLEVSDNFRVSIKFSDTVETVTVQANENLHQYIDLKVVDERLSIKLMGLDRIKGKETLNILITTKNINDVKATGNSKITLESPLYAPEFKIHSNGNGWFTGEIHTDLLDLSATGNCMFELEGDVKKLNGRFSGNCELMDYDLKIEEVKLDLSGNSNAYLSISKSITIKAKGNSMLFYKGNASIIHQNLSSGSKIIKKG